MVDQVVSQQLTKPVETVTATEVPKDTTYLMRGLYDDRAVLYTAPKTAQEANPYLKYSSNVGQEMAYRQFEYDKNLLAQNKPVQTIQDKVSSYGTDPNAPNVTRYIAKSGIGENTYYGIFTSGVSQHFEAGEKEAAYKQLAMKYEADVALKSGIPESYVAAAQAEKIAAAQPKTLEKPSSSQIVKTIETLDMSTLPKPFISTLEPTTIPKPFVSTPTPTTVITQPTGEFDLPFIGKTTIPILSDINKYFEQGISTTTTYEKLPYSTKVLPTGETEITGGMVKTVTSTPIPSSYENLNKDIVSTLKLPSPDSEIMKSAYLSGETYAMVNPITMASGIGTLSSKYLGPAIVSALPTSDETKKQLTENLKTSQVASSIVNPYSVEAFRDYYTPVYKEPLKAGIIYGISAVVPMIGGGARLTGVTDYASTSPRLYGAYTTASKVGTTALAAVYANYVSKEVTGTSIGDINKDMFGEKKVNPLIGMQERFPGIEQAVSKLRAIGVTEVGPMYAGYTSGAAISDIGVGYIKTRGVPEVNFEDIGYMAKEGYAVTSKLTTEKLQKGFETGEFLVPLEDISMAPTMKPATRIPGSATPPEGKIYAYSGSETNYLKQGYVGTGHSEISGMFVSQKGISYYTKPLSTAKMELGVSSSDILGILREPTQYRSIIGKPRVIPEDILPSKPTGINVNDPNLPSNIKISQYLETKGIGGEVNVGYYGKGEFQGIITPGSEVASNKIVAFYREGSLRIPIREVTYTGRISPKYKPPVREISTETGRPLREVGKMYEGVDITKSPTSKIKVPSFAAISYTSPSKISIEKSYVSSQVSSKISPISSTIISPVKSSITTPVKSSITTPVKSSITTPVKSSITTPVKSSITTPVKSSIITPVKSSITTPVKSSITTPVKSSITTPVKSSITTPFKSSITTPFKSSITTPFKSSITTPSKTSITTPSKIVIPIPTKFGDTLEGFGSGRLGGRTPSRFIEISKYGMGGIGKQLNIKTDNILSRKKKGGLKL